VSLIILSLIFEHSYMFHITETGPGVAEEVVNAVPLRAQTSEGIEIIMLE